MEKALKRKADHIERGEVSEEVLVLSSSKGTPKRGDPNLIRTDELARLPKQLYDDVRAFYTEELLRKHVIPYIVGGSKVSLRILDWLVTNYAKECPQKCEYILENAQYPFHIHESYRYQLKLKHKGGFDPFGRGGRILFHVGVREDGKEIKLQTTIAQLTFFKWAIENRVLDFAQLHYKEIETHMNERVAQKESEGAQVQSKPKRQKRRELSKATPRRARAYATSFELKL